MGGDQPHMGYGWLASVAATPGGVQRKLQPLTTFPGTGSAFQMSGAKWEGEGMERFHNAFEVSREVRHKSVGKNPNLSSSPW